MPDHVRPGLRELDETIPLCGVEQFCGRLERGLLPSRIGALKDCVKRGLGSFQLLNLTDHRYDPP